MTGLLLDVLRQNRQKGHFELHEYVIMPDHCHLMLTPAPDVSLEKAVQYIRGGFSFRAGRELEFGGPTWQAGFKEHRIDGVEDYEHHRDYIRRNPERAGLTGGLVHSSERPEIELDPPPLWARAKAPM